MGMRGVGSPLKVRKTRENLREATGLEGSLVALQGVTVPVPVPVPVPECSCLESGAHGMGGEDERLGSASSGSEVVGGRNVVQDASEFSNATTLVPERAQAKGLQRQKSVSRRVLSRVKSSMGGGRSQAAGRKLTDEEVESRSGSSSGGLFRRLSGLRKQSAELVDAPVLHTPSRKLGRDSVDSIIRPYAEDGGLGEGFDVGQAWSKRSFTGSTVSTSGILSVDRSFKTVTPDRVASKQKSPSPEPTPRASTWREEQSYPGKSGVQAVVPYVELRVRADCEAVDAAAEKDVWVAIVTKVCTSDVDLPCAPGGGSAGTVWPIGSIQSLRLCFKPAEDCQLLDIVGHKALKFLVPGQTSSLFVKVRVSSTSRRNSRDGCWGSSQDLLLAELESIVGTLETPFLHVEVKYRHSLLPASTVVTVRRLAKIRRPKAGSRWSQVETAVNDVDMLSVHGQLASFLAENYPPERALRLIERGLGAQSSGDEAVEAVRRMLCSNFERGHGGILGGRPLRNMSDDADTPAVNVTKFDVIDPNLTSGHQGSRQYSTMPCAQPLEIDACGEMATTPFQDMKSLLGPHTLPSAQSTPFVNAGSQLAAHTDSARALWRHLRRSSLSAAAHSADLTAEQLCAEDAVVAELQQKAIANKRSIGAETLRAWKWEGRVGSGSAVPPWL